MPQNSAEILKSVIGRPLLHEEARLKDSLAIRKPNQISLPKDFSIEDAAGLLANLSRTRAVVIPWADLITPQDSLAGDDEVTRLKNDFEASFNVHPLQASAGMSQFLEIAPDYIGERLSGVGKGDVLLYLPGPKRSDGTSRKSVLRVEGARPRFDVIRRYLGPDPTLNWRYYKVVAKPGLPLDFWKEATYAAAWQSIGDLVELRPMEYYRGTYNPFTDQEAQNKIPALTLQTAKSDFEAQVRSNVRADAAVAPAISLFITKAQANTYWYADRSKGEPVKAAVPAETVLIRFGNGEKVYQINPLPHIAAASTTLFEKLSGAKGLANYEHAWSNDVASADRVYTGDGYDLAFTEARYIDLAAPFIRRRFWEVSGRIDMFEKIVAQFQKAIPASLDVTGLSIAELEAAIAKSTDIQARLAASRSELQALKSLAQSLGYVLVTEDSVTIKVPNPTGAAGEVDKTLQKGQLYKKVKKVAVSFEERKVNTRPARRRLLDILGQTNSLFFANNVAPMLNVGGLGVFMGRNPFKKAKRVLGKVASAFTLSSPIVSTVLVVDQLLNRSRGGGSGGSYAEKVVTSYTDYELENSAQFSIDQTVGQLRRLGFNVFLFAKEEAGYTDAAGRTLADVMGLCRFDENFRAKCAVLIPRMGESMFEPAKAVGYDLFMRPIPGENVVEPPRLWIEDRLSFASQWLGTEVGMPVDSINLAPGESRKIAITREYAAASHYASEVTDELDVNESYTQSFSTEFERTVRHEQEKTRSDNWSGNVSGSYGGFVSGGASGGSNSTKTVRDFAQDISRAATKAASEVTRKSRQSIKTTSSQDTSIKTSDSTSSEVTNINAGATLNLTFFQLNNVFGSTITADAVRLRVSSGVELIAGSGIVEQRSYPLNEVEDALDYLVSARMFTAHLAKSVPDVLGAVLDELVKVIRDDYVIPLMTIDLANEPVLAAELKSLSAEGGSAVEKYLTTFKSNNARAANPANSGAQPPAPMVGGIPDINALVEASFAVETPEVISEKSEDAWREVIAKRVELIVEMAAKWAKKPIPITQTSLRLPSSAVYFDSALGEGRAVELYSDLMRMAELEEKTTKVDAIKAVSEVERAKAAAIGKNASYIFKGLYQLQEPKIAKIDGGKIHLSAALPTGTWMVSGDIEPIVLEAKYQGSTTIELADVDLTRKAVRIVEITSGIFIAK
jgi:hypothetical protein